MVQEKAKEFKSKLFGNDKLDFNAEVPEGSSTTIGVIERSAFKAKISKGYFGVWGVPLSVIISIDFTDGCSCGGKQFPVDKEGAWKPELEKEVNRLIEANPQLSVLQMQRRKNHIAMKPYEEHNHRITEEMFKMVDTSRRGF